MKRWALIVAALYLLILAVLTVPALLLAFVPEAAPKEAAQVYLHWQYWLWLAVMAVSQCALLAVPVRLAGGRPVTRGPVWRTVLAGGLMAGGLAAGAFLSLYELVFRDKAGDPHHFNACCWTFPLLGAATWTLWAVVFARMSRSVPPADWVSRQCQWLFQGSVLELLVAVPTHIVARCRDYCCAGFLTFVGLTMGVSVMLFAFGPAVVFLFAERWKRLHPLSQTPATKL
jgi:hypothetical protein